MDRNFLLLVTCLVACRDAATANEEAPRPPAAVTCTPVQGAEVADELQVTGVIAPPPRLDAVIGSPVAGRVGQVFVEEGDRVVAGTLLVTIDEPSLPASAVEARAVVGAATATLVAAQQELARQKRLVDSGIGARRDLDEARAKAASASADVSSATARAGLANRNNARRELRAPHAGVVLHLWKRAGETVDATSATPVLEIADVSTLELRAQVPPSTLPAVREGMTAAVTVAGSATPLPARVVRVAPAVDPVSLLVTVRIQIEGTRELAVGSPATATITGARHPGVLVPSAAVRRSLVGATEVIVCENGTARVRSVSVRTTSEGTSEVMSGLVAGELIVLDHPLGLEEGQQLTAALPAKSR